MAYHSQKFSDIKKKYNVYNRKLLAIIDALQYWRAYCKKAMSLNIYTNHKNLRYFTTTKTFNMRQVRWLELLRQYKFIIYYIFRKDNGRADALSRKLNYIITKKKSFALLAEGENRILTNTII